MLFQRSTEEEEEDSESFAHHLGVITNEDDTERIRDTNQNFDAIEKPDYVPRWKKAIEFLNFHHMSGRQILLILMLYVGNIAFTFGAEVDDAVTVMKEQTDWWDQKDSALLLSFSAGFYALGTVVMGSLADRLGGGVTFIGSLILSGILNLIIGLCDSAWSVLAFNVLNIIIGAAAWSSMTNIVSFWFEDDGSAVAFVFCLLSTSDELGEFLSGIVLGSLVQGGIIGWRGIFFVQGAIAVVVGIILAFCLNGKPVRRHQSMPKHHTHDIEIRPDPPSESSENEDQFDLYTFEGSLGNNVLDIPASAESRMVLSDGAVDLLTVPQCMLHFLSWHRF